MSKPLVRSSVKAVRSLGEKYAKQACLTCHSPNNSVVESGYACPISGFPLTCSDVCYQDILQKHDKALYKLESVNEDLHWFRSKEAQDVLAIEQKYHKDLTKHQAASSLSSWEEYAQAVGHTNHKDPKLLRLLSSLNSFTMTLGHFSKDLFPENAENVHLGILGARAEASMPMFLWSHLLEPLYRRRYSVSLIGDQVAPRRPHHSRVQVSSLIELRYISALFHNVPEEETSDMTSYVLFNPGIGHPKLKEQWKTSIVRALEQNIPMLLTSYSERDQERDMMALSDIAKENEIEFQYLIEPTSNPFGSLRYELDPLDVLNPVQANKHIAIVQKK